MNDLPLVSIVTPSFNQAQYLEKTIRSVLEQDYPNLEYVIVDGGSTDGSVDVIKKYAGRLAWWVSEPDCGQTEAINKGFSHASGQIYAWLNSDDTYQPCAIREAVDFFQQNPHSVMVYGGAHYIDENDRVIGNFPAAQTDLKRLRRGYVHIPQQSSFFTAAGWKKVAPLDQSFYFAMDYDLWVRLAQLGPISYYPRMWANFRLHQDAKTIAADDRCWPEMLRVHYRDGGSSFAPIVWKSWLRKMAAPYIRWKRKELFKQEEG
ncbi:MAG: glycosyltransferase family 2 protein [Anaerolineaceae bacterium]